LVIILIRTVILYFVVLFVIRIMGKAELSNLDPFQMVVLFMIAELAAIPIESTNIAVLNGVTAILTLLLLEVVISVIALKSEKFNNFINGKPSILIDKGKIDEKELVKLRITLDDLAEQLRLKNISSMADVDYAVLESNGDLSVIPKPEKRPLTPEDMNINMNDTVMPMILIADGSLYHNNLSRIEKDENYLKKELNKLNISDYSQVFLCFFDEDSQLHVYPKVKSKKGFMKERDNDYKEIVNNNTNKTEADKH